MRFPREVYVITHRPTGRQYVGSSFDPEMRISMHLCSLRRHAHNVELMQEDFDKYGDDYECKVIDHIENITEKHKEYDWMEKFCSNVTGYNYKDRHNEKLLNERERL